MAPKVGRPRKSAAGSSPPPTHPSRSSFDDSIVSTTEEVNNTKPALSRTLSFKGVVIPARPRDEDTEMKSKPVSDSRRASNSTSSLSAISSASPFTANDSDAETPETSAISTPAESISTSKPRFSKSRLSENPFVAQVKGKGKRKRTSTVVDGDAALAQALQEEEYGIDISKHIHPSLKKRRRTLALDSDDDAESIKSESSEDVPLMKKSKPKKKAMNTTARPGREAAKSASKALKNAAGTILDSEEGGSDLSDFVDDEDDDAVSKVSGVKHFAGVSEDESDALSSADEADNGFDFHTADGETNWERRKKITRARRERAKLEQSHPEIKTMWDELDAVPLIPAEEAPQPASISRKLKSFQLEGLNWMIKQEQSQWKGGLLGDEMGMGKTIQAVSLIMSDYPTKPHQPTLVVVPPVALMQWTNEINDYTSGQLKVLLYHGQNAKAKQMSVSELKKYDVIMISYSGLESIYRKQEKGWTRKEKIVKETSAIHEINFHRLILDEAHSIKSRTAGVAKACFALKSTYKWCLSGTPVQNRIGEFFSLLRFLGVTPFANYFCKECPCAKIDWQTTADYRCTGCNHRTLSHVSVFNQEILNPIVSGDSDEQRKLGLKKLRMLTDHIMLRRMKRDQTASMELPPKEVVIHNEFFGEIERDFSSSIMSNTARTFDTYVSRGVMLNNYANIFGLIMQMRQVSDHPDLLLKKHSEIGQNVLICNICDEPAEEAIRSRCKHDFCRVCAKDYVKTCEASGATPDCPRCHISLSIDFDQPDLEQDTESVKKTSIINRIKMENWTSSTKIEMLVYDLYKLRSKKTTLKSIVFSQFTSMLQLIEWRLRRAGFNTVMLDGSMTPQQRQKSIEYFMNNTDVEVFLVSLKAGGVALNLTEASRVFIVDPWWNPAAEWQSADRCHRIGQRRPCVITRLCIEDSVESRIVMLQEKKANLIQGTVNNDEVAMDKLTPEDMQFLFRGS